MGWFKTPLGLWVLSAVFLTLLPFAYTSITHRQDEASARRQQLTRINIEIATRIEQWLIYSQSEPVAKAFHQDFSEFVTLLLRPPNATDPLVPMYSVYKEFSDEPLMVVLMPARSLDPTDGEVLQSIRSMVTFRFAPPEMKPDARRTLSQLANDYLDKTGLRKWAFKPPPGTAQNLRIVP